MPETGKRLIDKRIAKRPLPKKRPPEGGLFLAIPAPSPRAGDFDPTSMDQKS
jgi:hypothetical protein